MNTFKPHSTQKVRVYFVDWVEFYLGTIWSLGYAVNGKGTCFNLFNSFNNEIRGD